MKKSILVASLLAMAMAAVAPAQAHHARRHYHHHAGMYHRSAMSYPDTVMLDGKEYKVCKEGMMDDCVNPRQAGLNFGNMPIDHYEPHDDMPSHP